MFGRAMYINQCFNFLLENYGKWMYADGDLDIDNGDENGSTWSWKNGQQIIAQQRINEK
jgi:hypothetical protein